MLSVVQDVLFPLMCYSDADQELWNSDPYEYVRVKFGEYVCLCVCVYVCVCVCVCVLVFFISISIIFFFPRKSVVFLNF